MAVDDSSAEFKVQAGMTGNNLQTCSAEQSGLSCNNLPNYRYVPAFYSGPSHPKVCRLHYWYTYGKTL